MKLTHSKAVALMVLATLMWSIAGVVTRQLESARSFEVTFWRSLFNALSLLLILPVLQGKGALTQLRKGGTAFWLSSLCWSVMFTAFMVAMTLTTVANVLVTMALSPLITALLARGFTAYRIPLRTWIAIVMAGLGIAWMYGGQLFGGSHLAGTLVAFLVPLASAGNWTIVQHSQSAGRKIDLVPAVLAGAIISALVTLPFAMPFASTLHDIGLLAMLGLVQLAIPCVLVVWCAGALKAPEVALLALLEVIFGILLAWIGAGERPGLSVLSGGALVIAALVVNELIGWRQNS